MRTAVATPPAIYFTVGLVIHSINVPAGAADLAAGALAAEALAAGFLAAGVVEVVDDFADFFEAIFPPWVSECPEKSVATYSLHSSIRHSGVSQIKEVRIHGEMILFRSWDFIFVLQEPKPSSDRLQLSA